MQIIYDRADWKEEAAVATVGFFDGVHAGHRFLLRQLCDLAKLRRLPAAVITFTVHPRGVLHADCQSKLLNSFEEKLSHLSLTGIDYVIVMDFTPELAALTAREFVTSVLAAEWHVRTLLTGFNHRFGYRRADGFEQYVDYGRACGMEVVKVASYDTEQGIAVSSSVIRQRIEAGDMVAVSRLLGYRYRLKGRVVSGHQIGRLIGFPTANMAVDEPLKLIPRNGSYAVGVTVGDRQYKGMAYIGSRPTIGNDDSFRIEVHIFDFSKAIYDEPVTVEFVAFIREERKFNSLDELGQQMAEDEKTALRLCRGALRSPYS